MSSQFNHVVSAENQPIAAPEAQATVIAAQHAANAVSALFPNQVVNQASPEFAEAQKTYWNQRQQQRVPRCWFRPTTVEQVKAAIVEVVKARSPFAIRGGGHSSNTLGSSSQGGFLFDLSALNHAEITEDRKSIRLGPGVHWGELFQYLETQGVICLGGRDYGVGVPGFIFGGGLSFYTTRYGWAIDSLLSVDIVLADGSLVFANAHSHPDLFRALRGGGAHNFGIVTSLTLKLYPYEGFWGGMNVVAEEHFDDMFKGYDEYTKALEHDNKAHLIMDFARQDGSMIACHTMAYTKRYADPPIFAGLRNVPSIANTCRLTNISELATEVQVTTDCRHKRNMYWTHTFAYDIDLLKAVYKLWAERSEKYSDRFRFALSINHVTPEMRNKAAREGLPNVYGLEGSETLQTNVLFTCTWDDPSDDDEATTLLRLWTREAEAMEQQQGKQHKYKYMNYAHAEQDVISGFGDENKTFLHKVSARYDPDGIFQTLQPGGFKLGTFKASHAML